MVEKMYASVLHGPRDVRYEQIDLPELAEGEVLVDVKATGVCGSDIPRVLSDGAHFYPIVLGHEFAGRVKSVAPGVEGFTVGQKVAGAPLVPCLHCEQCQTGNYAMCPNYTFIGSRRFGALAEYVAVPAQNLLKVPESVSFIEAAMVEPSTVALHGILVADYRPGRDVAILGGGTIGLFTAQWAKLLGAKSVTVFDISDERLEIATELGVDRVINTMSPDFPEVERQLIDAGGFGVVFETAGQNATQILGLKLAGRGAQLSLIGNSHRDLEFSAQTFELINRKELKLAGSWMSYSAPFPGREWTDTLEYLADGRLKVIPRLLHGTFTLEQLPEAFALFEQPGAVKGKIMFVQQD